MELQNFNNREEEIRQLYRIRYGYRDQPKEVHLLASSFVNALDMFPIFYQAGSNNPSEFPESVDEETRDNALNVISSIERIADAVIARKEDTQ